MSKVIGIDLGTTNSCVSVVEGGKPVIIPNDLGGRTTPSVVAFSKNGERLVGGAAQRQAAVNSERTVTSVKRHMGTDWSKNIDGKYYSPQEFSAMILRKLRADAEAYLGAPVTDAVITVPAYFNDIQRQATKDAGTIAGLNVMRIINEPTAAALAYGLDNGAPQKIMVYDLGGGTFDVSIIEIGDGVIEVLATNGDNHLGGDDFDTRVTEHLLSVLKREFKTDIRKDGAALQRVRQAAEDAKKELSQSETAQISLPYLTVSGSTPFHFSYTLTRARFNELTADLVRRTEGPVRNALRDAGISADRLGMVLLVGGSTRIPAVQEMVQRLTGKRPSKQINPDECVAQGAAIQADTLSGGKLVMNTGSGLAARGAGARNGILLLDVTPLSLSIETLGRVATRLVDRNSSLPVHYSKVFTTAAPYQRSVDIHVLQGERPMAADNKTIGRFRLNGIQAAPAGVPQIEVTFDIDTNGILTVSARDLTTGTQQSITITDNGRMSPGEIQQAIRDAERYASQDGIRRKALELQAEAQKLSARTERAMKQAEKQLDKQERKTVKNDHIRLNKAISRLKLEFVDEAQLEDLRGAMDALQRSGAHVRQLAGIEE